MGGNNTGRKRRFGSVRRLPSGNWQVRYPGPDGQMRTDDHTHPTKTAADQRLVEIEADVRRGQWIDPDAGSVTLAEYAATWIADRDLQDRTRELYLSYMRNHVNGTLGSVPLSDLSAPRIRSWRSELLRAGVGAPTMARCYSLLRAVLNTATDDELIRRNPCRISGAGQNETPERPIASLAEVLNIAAAMPPRYRLLILLAAFGQLRFGELVALRRSDLRISDGVVSVRVARALAELNSGDRKEKGPKSTAGRRTVSLPTTILPDIRHHLDRFAQDGPQGLLFVGPQGATPRRSSFNRTWKRALTVSGANPSLRLHDLRHTGGTLAAQTGATLKELMSRIGHGSARAAMIYQHSTSQRDQQIADALDQMILDARTAK